MFVIAVAVMTLPVCAGSIHAQEPPVPDPAAWTRDAPERILARYLLAWRDRDWPRMAEVCLISWRLKVGDRGAAKFLELSHGINDLAGARIESFKVRGGTFAIARAMIWYNHKGVRNRHLLKILMARQDGQGRETRDGGWGVLPTSFETRRLVD